jgi:hypothetical protein
MQSKGKICKQWDGRACRIDDLNLQQDGDFYVVTGKATNVIQYSLPHLELRLSFYDTDRRLILKRDFHVTNRVLVPRQTCRFKFEGEWRPGMSSVQAEVCPYPSKRDINIDIPSPIHIRELNPYQDELIVGSKRSTIQKGDLIFVRADDLSDITIAFGGLVRLVTRSPFYHMVVYDHGGRFVHAGWPKVEDGSLWDYFLRKPNLVLSWGRCLYRDGREVTGIDGDKAVSFIEAQMGKRYDLLANLSFLFRSDGIPNTPYSLRKVFQSKNHFNHRRRWGCSEIVGAAWYFAAGIVFVENMADKTYVSPADIYDSLYCRQICQLKILEGVPSLLVKQSTPALVGLAYQYNDNLVETHSKS